MRKLRFKKKGLRQTASTLIADMPILILYLVVYTLITLTLFYSLAAFVLSVSTSLSRNYIQADSFGLPFSLSPTTDAYARIKWGVAGMGIGQLVEEWGEANQVNAEVIQKPDGLRYNYIRVSDRQPMPMAIVSREYNEFWVVPLEKFYADHEER